MSQKRKKDFYIYLQRKRIWIMRLKSFSLRTNLADSFYNNKTVQTYGIVYRYIWRL